MFRDTTEKLKVRRDRDATAAFPRIVGIGMLMLAFAVFLPPTARAPVGQLNPATTRSAPRR